MEVSHGTCFSEHWKHLRKPWNIHVETFGTPEDLGLPLLLGTFANLQGAQVTALLGGPPMSSVLRCPRAELGELEMLRAFGH